MAVEGGDGITETAGEVIPGVWIGIAAYIPLAFFFYFTGTTLFVFYKSRPEVVLPEKADAFYPFFAMHQMSPVLAALVIAAIFAASMSSIDSCTNSASSVCMQDFVRRFRTSPNTDRHDLRLARWLTAGWGVLGMGMGLCFMNIQYAQIVWGKLIGSATNGILGLMALAFLPRRINLRATTTGFVVSCVCLDLVMSLTSINFLLWPVIGNSVYFLTALGLNAVGKCKNSAIRRETGDEATGIADDKGTG